MADDKSRNVIADSIKLIAGRIGQEYNVRKNRKGAFWEDRYHGTALEKNRYLRQCITYIDMNMVRAGVVKHPEDWPFGGYRYMMTPPKRYRLTDNKKFIELMNIREFDRLRETYRNWVDSAIMRGEIKRQSLWTGSITVGDKVYVEKVKDQMGYKAIGRKVFENGDSFALRDPQISYQSISNRAVRLQQGDNTIIY